MPSSRAVELAHGVLMPGFAGTQAPDWLLEAIDGGLGGVCYFGHNIESPEQVARLSACLHAGGPTVIAVDEEGGIVTRLHARTGSPHVGAAVLGRGADTVRTGQVAGLIAAELRSAGIDLDLAPVADVNSNPANPVIGVRSFGDDPRRVGAHVTAFIAGLQDQGVAACAKHFPGHGDTSVDSHAGLPTVVADPETLRRRELEPFRAAIAAGVRCIMTAHAVYPSLDSEPATLSPAVLGLLRGELSFEGVIVSDAIDMQAISATVGFAEGVVRALIAGVDLVALGNPVLGIPVLEGTPHGGGRDEFAEALEAILRAVDQGRLSEDRLERSVRRIRDLADWTQRPITPASSSPPGANADAAAQALRSRGAVRQSGPVHIVDVRRRRNIASGRLMPVLAQTLLDRLPGSSIETAFAPGRTVEGRADCGDTQESAGPISVGAPDVIITGTPGQDPAEQAALESLLRMRPEAVVVCLGWSSDPGDIPAARNAVFSFGDSLPSARAITALLAP